MNVRLGRLPTVPMPELEPVAYPDCRTCWAADRGRTAARQQQAAGRVREFNKVISTHPRHGAPPPDGPGESEPERGGASVDRSRQPSTASLDPCGCPEPYCPLRRPPNEQRALLGADSPALTDLRARIAADLASRRRHGLLGRLL